MRINHQAAFVLHTRPWSETSLLVDVFTHAHGRFRVLAKGARRRKTGQRAELQPFQPLSISWQGKRGMPVLVGVEAIKLHPRLKGQQLASAYYMSELLFKFLHANDAHETLFDAYDAAILALSNKNKLEATLRTFECALLSEIGYGLQLTHDANTQQAIEENARYIYYPEKGPVKVSDSTEQNASVSGRTILAIASQCFDDMVTLKESKHLLRMLLTRQIKGRTFRTRSVYAQMLNASQNYNKA